MDYQLDVEQGDAYSANITQLSAITAPLDNNVRYGNQTSDWDNTVTDPANASVPTNTVAYRYALAAALVSEYEGPNSSINSPLTTTTPDPVNSPDPTNPVDNSVDQAIQTAIWYVTYNSDYGPTTWPPFSPSAYNVQQGLAASNPSNYLYWVNWAENNVDSVNLNDWGVISGPVQNGVLQTPNGVFQTFLVQLTPSGTVTTFEGPAPEPTFYWLMALGLGVMFTTARFRNRAAKHTA